MNEALTSIVRDLNKFRGVLSQSKVFKLMAKVKIIINTNYTLQDQSDSYQREVTSRLTNIKRTVEDLKEKTWKLDNNTRSNLVFYGIKEDGSCCNAEFAVKEVWSVDKELSVTRHLNDLSQVIRSQLAISRDMPFIKVARSNEEDAKGVKPIVVTFEKQTVGFSLKLYFPYSRKILC